ncbi:MAG: hypothetical protein M1820_004106 [Bogoriella megaspora]|nr:MAG: hypothetical protein M1820_004106 [Bogoriella megaspora]
MLRSPLLKLRKVLTSRRNQPQNEPQLPTPDHSAPTEVTPTPVKMFEIWIYAFDSIDLEPIIAKTFSFLRAKNLRVEEISLVAKSPKPSDKEPPKPLDETTNKLRRDRVLDGPPPPKGSIKIKASRMASICTETQPAGATSHDLRLLKKCRETATNVRSTFVPIILHKSSIDDLKQQARNEGIDLDRDLNNGKVGLVVDVKDKSPEKLGYFLSTNIFYIMAKGSLE